MKFGKVRISERKYLLQLVTLRYVVSFDATAFVPDPPAIRLAWKHDKDSELVWGGRTSESEPLKRYKRSTVSYSSSLPHGKTQTLKHYIVSSDSFRQFLLKLETKMFFKLYTLIVATAAFAGIANAQVSGCGGGGSFTVSDIRYRCSHFHIYISNYTPSQCGSWCPNSEPWISNHSSARQWTDLYR